LQIVTSKIKQRNIAKLFKMPTRRRTLPFSVESRILFLRRQKVILDADLAHLYGVQVKRLNQQVNRNREKFPSDFMFQLSGKEHESLRLQFATSKDRRGGRRYLPYAFTEHGVIMAATVLNSERAVHMSVFVVRAFVRLREMLATNRQLAGKIDELERQMESHDAAIQDIFATIKKLLIAKETPRQKIGFQLPAATP
jgi:phage regulator Rha-like protein